MLSKCRQALKLWHCCQFCRHLRPPTVKPRLTIRDIKKCRIGETCEGEETDIICARSRRAHGICVDGMCKGKCKKSERTRSKSRLLIRSLWRLADDDVSTASI